MCSWICGTFSAFSEMTCKCTQFTQNHWTHHFQICPPDPDGFNLFISHIWLLWHVINVGPPIFILQEAVAHNTAEQRAANVHSALWNRRQIIDSPSRLPEFLCRVSLFSDSRENFHSKTKSHIDEVLFSFRGVWLDYVIHHGISIREGGRTAEGLEGNSGAAPCSNCPRAGMFCALMCPTGG